MLCIIPSCRCLFPIAALPGVLSHTYFNFMTAFLMPSGLHNDCIITDSINVTHLQGLFLTDDIDKFTSLHGIPRLHGWNVNPDNIPRNSCLLRRADIVFQNVNLLRPGDGPRGQTLFRVYLTVASWVIFSGFTSENISTRMQVIVKQPHIYQCLLGVIKLLQR